MMQPAKISSSLKTSTKSLARPTNALSTPRFYSSSSNASSLIRRSKRTPFQTVCPQIPTTTLLTPLTATPVLQYNGYMNVFKNFLQRREFSTSVIDIKVPSMGDSITDGSIETILKEVGQAVAEDEPILIIATSKVNHEVRAPKAGVIQEILVKKDDVVEVGKVVVRIVAGAPATAAAASTAAASSAPSPSQAPPPSRGAPPPPPPPTRGAPPPPPPPPAAASAPAARAAAPAAAPAAKPAPAPLQPVVPKTAGDRSERRETMSRMRQTIAANMKSSQNTLAMLTTFQEADMSELMNMRNALKDEFEAKHGIKLGFMSAFVKSAAAALVESPLVNAVIDGKEIVYRNYVDISVAVATPKGLAIPILRDVDRMSFADIEKQIAYLGQRARNNQLTLQEMTGGTFTISNGGVYGSLMGTPIINPGQSAILGMHGIFERPVAVKGQVVIRPMMYLALTYDHRLIDGRDAVTFLKKIKFCVEDPRRLLLD